MYKNGLKRILDIVLSLIGLLTFSPILCCICIAIKLTSNGPILYTQERIGINFKPFKLYKFRSMITHSDKKGLLITAKNDSRITKTGKILRKTKCDELPQLWNVLKGDMSIIGPRPEVEKYVQLFQKEWDIHHLSLDQRFPPDIF